MSVDLLVKMLMRLEPGNVGGVVPFALLQRLCWRADDDGTVRKPLMTLADEIGVHHGTARRAIRELEDRGFVEPLGNVSGGRVATRYRVVLNAQNERVNPRTERGLPAQRTRVNPRGERDEKNRKNKNRKNARVRTADASVGFAREATNGEGEPTPIVDAVARFVAGLQQHEDA